MLVIDEMGFLKKGRKSVGVHLNARDVKAVCKTVSGLIKLLYPDGEISRENMAELVDPALEGCCRVQGQLKKTGSFEYHQTSFSYIDNETHIHFR